MDEIITAPETRIMAIDFGEKRIGIALSDPLFIFAYPHTALENDSELIKNLGKIVSEKKIKKIILGLPSSLKSASAKIAAKVYNFKEELINKFDLEVILWDEEYTSVMAQQKVLESVTGKKKRKNKSLVDQNAAAIILQEYLDSI
jgi:putative pre-16S rRNA nuclease